MKRLFFIYLALFLGLSLSEAYAYWIWTPKTGRFVNPKTAVKPTPEEQFEYARAFYEQDRHNDAKREFIKLVRSYPKSFEASESQYYIGRIEEAQGNLYEAYLAYQRVVDIYPFSERIKEIIEREYKIGEEFMSGYRRKALGVPLPVENPAIEIFAKVVENSFYGPLAPKAQYKLGLVLKSLARYYEAEEAFNKVLVNYPESEWAAATKFQLASARAAVSRGPEYDQVAAEEAREKFEEFVRENPDAVLSRDAQSTIEQIQEREAEGIYNIGRFYEKQRQNEAAKIYYQDIISRYGDSFWAAKALERMRVLDKNK